MEAVAGRSTIPGAGLGLFATRAYKRGDFVTVYSGVVSRRAPSGDRVLDLAPPYSVDGIEPCRHPAGRGDLVNHAPGRPNCRYAIVDSRMRLAAVIATRRVAAGDEFFTSYGPHYCFGA